MNLNKTSNIIVSLVILIFIFMLIKDYRDIICFASPNTIIKELNVKSLSQYSIDNKIVTILSSPTCKGCLREKQFINDELSSKYKEINFKYYNVYITKNKKIINRFYKDYKLDINNLATPTTFIGTDVLIGFNAKSIDGVKLNSLIQKNFYNNSIKENKTVENNTNQIKTIFGTINLLKLSLPMIAITLGLVDGFNPCAMWVLVYLISLISALENKNKKWGIVGTFILASGILYYLFITALLNVFLYIGYLRIIELVISCFAIYLGLSNLEKYLLTDAVNGCKITNLNQRQKTMNFAKKIINSKNIILSIIGIIALAFTVNLIEFMCSAGLPAIFTGILSQSNLSTFHYHLYTFLYVFSFMLDDLIIFSLAIFALDKFSGDKYVGKSKIIGGIILLLLGIIMVFFPNMLK